MCGVAFAEDVDKEPANEVQPVKVSAAALGHGVDECVVGMKSADDTTAMKFCGCMFDYERSTVKDNAKKLGEMFASFDPSKIRTQLDKCIAWGKADAKNKELPIDTPYSKTLDLSTEVIWSTYVTCTATAEEKKIPEKNRIGFCSCMVDSVRAVPAATLAKAKKARGKDLNKFVAAEQIDACIKNHDIMKFAPK